ncbi:MAG: BatD family protein [Oleiphilaceae bacterium]|nr:BatD family protein [Oleiphilaceae bacterium]
MVVSLFSQLIHHHTRVQRLCIALLLLFATSAHAQNTLTASVDRNQIYETDTFTYELIGELEVQSSFGGILSFGRSQISEPSIPDLEKHFEILDRQQKMSMHTVNGKSQSQLVWRYTLAPKASGTFTIGPADYEGTKSNVITMKVLPGISPKDASAPPLVFIEVETDKSEVFVQEQIQFTVRLYSSGSLVAGDLDQPTASDVIVEGMGETKVYYRMAHNQRYEVRERNYLLFPQKSGELTIDALKFSGTMIDSRKRRRVRVREQSEETRIKVNPPPTAFTGDVWLPATSLHLTEKWDKVPDQLEVGDSVTRTIETQALGLLASALPPIHPPQLQRLKVYPDKAHVETMEHQSGAQSLRRETAAFVAVSAGEVTLPEVSIPWWDTVNNVQRVAVLPARTIRIAGAPPSADRLPAGNQSQTVSPPPAIDTAGTQEETSVAPIEAPKMHFWYALVILLALGWLSTLVYFLRQRGQQRNTQHLPEQENHWALLHKAIKQGDANMPKHLIAWAQEHFCGDSPIEGIVGIADLKRYDQTLYRQAMAFEQMKYAPAGSDNRFDPKTLQEHLKKLRSDAKKQSDDTGSIKPLYPNMKRA